MTDENKRYLKLFAWAGFILFSSWMSTPIFSKPLSELSLNNLMWPVLLVLAIYGWYRESKNK
jgi:hypothetical protein